MADSENREPTDPASIELPRPMPYSLRWALGAAAVGLGYMVAVVLFGLFGLMLAMPTFGILLVGLICALVGLAKKQNRHRTQTCSYIASLIIIARQVLFLIPGLGTIRLLNLHCRMRVAMSGGQSDLQAWAVELLAQPRDPMHQDGSGWRIPREECSKQVQRLKPKRISVEQLFENDQEGVRLMYGGGFLHWNIVLGPPGSVPDPKFEETLTENDWFRWSDGVYCWFPD